MWIGVAALLGVAFVVLHVVTIIVTCAVAGTDWGTAAWCLDISGFLAGAFFTFYCWRSSSTCSALYRSNNKWIVFWAGITVATRILDTLMLFGVVKFDAVYQTPTGAVLVSNVISEVLVANAYTVVALVGSVRLVFFPQDQGGDSEVDHGALLSFP